MSVPRYSIENNSEVVRIFKTETSSILEEKGAVLKEENKMGIDTISTISPTKIGDYYYSLSFSLKLPVDYYDRAEFRLTLGGRRHDSDSQFQYLLCKANYGLDIKSCGKRFRSIIEEFLECIEIKSKIVKFAITNNLPFTFENDSFRIKKQRVFINFDGDVKKRFSGRYYNKEILKNLMKYAEKHRLNHEDLL